MIFKKLKRNTYTEKTNSVGRGTSTANIVLLNRKDFFPHKVNHKAKIICSHHSKHSAERSSQCSKARQEYERYTDWKRRKVAPICTWRRESWDIYPPPPKKTPKS